MSDVKRADCRVVMAGWAGGEAINSRPMTEADLDSLIRERGITEIGWCERHKAVAANVTPGFPLCDYAEYKGYDNTPPNECLMRQVWLLAALTGTEKE